MSKLPEDLYESILGKRTAPQAGLEDAVQVKHIRDYAHTITKGGQKGEVADYMLVASGDSEYRYLPVTSRFKLNKKRLARDQFDEAVSKQV